MEHEWQNVKLLVETCLVNLKNNALRLSVQQMDIYGDILINRNIAI